MGNNNPTPIKQAEPVNLAEIQRAQESYQNAVRVQEEETKRKTNALKYNDDDLLPEPMAATERKPDAKTEGSDPSNPNDPISLSFKLKYSSLQVNSASETVEPALFTLKTKNVTGDRAFIDLVCVLDTSFSMNGEKLRLLQDTLQFYLLPLLCENDRISIVSFSNLAKRYTPLLRVTKDKIATISQAIRSLAAKGGTDITAGMAEAIKIFNDRRHRNPVSSVFLLSDGIDPVALAGVKSLLETQKPKDNFTINTFGYGSDHDPSLMSSLVNLTDGKFYSIETLSTVNENFVHAIGGLLTVMGQDATINIQPVKSEIFPNIQIKKAFGGSDLWNVSDGAYTTRISQLSSGCSRNYVLELTIPKFTKELNDEQREVVLAKATVTMISSNGEVMNKECDLKVNLINEDEELPQQQADKDLLSNYYRVRAAEILLEARKLADEGDYEGGRKILTNFTEELRNSTVKDEFLVKELLEDILAIIEEMHPEQYVFFGKHRLYQQAECHLKERSNLNSKKGVNMYSNEMEREFVEMARSNKRSEV